MRTANRTMHFDSNHTIAGIAVLADGALVKRFGETRPSGAGIELVCATEEWRIATDTAVEAYLLIVMIRIPERRLRALLTGHMILQIC